MWSTVFMVLWAVEDDRGWCAFFVGLVCAPCACGWVYGGGAMEDTNFIRKQDNSISI